MALEGWERHHEALLALAAAARTAAGPGGGIDGGVILKPNEVGIWSGDGTLIEPRRQPGSYTGAYSGVSFKIAKGVRYNIGGSRGHYVPGPEVQSPVDQGRIAVTTQRVVFVGGKATREWSFSKLIGIDGSTDDSSALIHVSNRQKVSGLVAGGGLSNFVQFLAVAVAVFNTGAASVIEECDDEVRQHLATRPPGV